MTIDEVGALAGAPGKSHRAIILARSMLLGWFDSREAIAAGSSLAEQFLNGAELAERRRIKPKRGRPALDPMGGLLQSLERDIRPLRLNFYKRAKLANAFKWRLLEGGVATEAADEVTRSLVMQLSLVPRGATPLKQVDHLLRPVRRGIDKIRHYLPSLT